MQMALQTRLQEYVYLQAKDNLRERLTSRRNKVSQIECILDSLDISKPSTSQVNSQYLLSQFFAQNQTKIVNDLRSREYE